MDRVEGPSSIQPPLYEKFSDIVNPISAMYDVMRFLMTNHVTEEMCEPAEVLVTLVLYHVHWLIATCTITWESICPCESFFKS
jgi:hypothetical protein